MILREPQPFEGGPPKWFIILLGQFVAFGPLSIDMYLPALPDMAWALETDSAHIQYTLISFFIGFCLGMLFYGPIADIYGRRRVINSGLVLYAVASCVLCFTSDVECFIFWRFLQAFGAGAAIVMGRAIARDVYGPAELPRVLSLMQLVTMSAPLLAPIIGGYLTHWFGFRSIFCFLTLLSVVLFVTTYAVLPETIPERSADRSVVVTAFMNYGQLITDRDAFGTIGTLAFTMAGMFAFVAGSPFVYIEYFEVSETSYGWLFALNVIGMIAVLLLNVQLLKFISLTAIMTTQVVGMAVVGLMLWCGHDSSLACIVVLVVLYISTTNAIAANSISQLLKFRPAIAGSATALAVSSQFGWGGISSYLLTMFQDGTPWAMCTLMAFFGILSLLCFMLVDRNEVSTPHDEINDELNKR